MTVEELRILLRVNGESSYTQAMGRVTNATNTYNNSVGALTSTLARLVSAAAVTKFAKDCIRAASDLQEVANVTDVTFGKSASVINEWAKSQAANFGLSETSAKRNIGTYGTMAKQFGFTTEQAAQMGVELTKLTGDVASFYNIDEKLSSIKLKSIFTGETETLKELGVVMTEANLNNYALEKGISKTVKQMNEHEKVMLRYQFVMDKLSHTNGDFQRTSDGWANSTRTLSLNLENLKIQIGNELLPVAGQGLALVNSGIQAIAPKVIAVAHTIRLYGEAWKNANDTTKAFVKASAAAVAIMVVAPKIIAVTSAAVKLLTMQIVTLGSALKATLGIVGIALAVAALFNLSKQVNELKTEEATQGVDNLGESAEISADSVDDLSDSVDNLSNAAKGLDLFLASFDEVNKVGGNSSLMSNLVNSDDLANIAGAAGGLGDINSIINDINSGINGVSVPDIGVGNFLDAEWWRGKRNNVKGFLSTFITGDWKENWMIGAEEITSALHDEFPEITDFLTNVGETLADIFNPAISKVHELTEAFENSAWYKYFYNAGEKLYDVTHDSPEDLHQSTRSGSHGGSGHRRYASGGYPSKGSLFIAGEAGAELVGNFGGSQTKVINQSQITNNTQPMVFSPTIQLDSRKITAVVIDNINTMTRSSGNSPLIQLGGN